MLNKTKPKRAPRHCEVIQMELEEQACKTLASVRIEFDGGTPCNIPRLGYGEGYGSYQVNGRGIIRLNFKRPMSANAAEVWTLVAAIRWVWKCYLPKRTVLQIHGDSQNALNRCHRLKKAKASSDEYSDGCQKLFDLCRMFHSVETHWRGRQASVKLFGH